MRRLLSGVALVLAAGSLAGQEAEPPVFPASTEAVLLDMVVRDAEGRLVPDLRADEIQVLEDGQLCAITSFRFVRAEDAGRPAPDLADPTGDPPDLLGPLPRSPGSARQGIQPPDEGARSVSVEDESLREPRGGSERVGSVVLLVFDHLGRDAAHRAREAALDMIGQVVSRSEVELPLPDASGRVAYLGQFPADAFEPGRYVVHARRASGDRGDGGGDVLPGGDLRAGARASRGRRGRSDRQPKRGRDVPRPDVPADIAPLLDRAGQYVVDFQDKFRNIVAEETYRQWTADDVLTLRSDIVFVTLPADIPWVTFRDVYEVNGQEVRDRDARLQALFMKPDGSTLGRAEAIRRESARFNLGATYRDINVPTLALLVLHPQHQGRFRWERKGTREFSGRTGVELRAVEVVSPTLVRELDGSDVTAEVRFWIELKTGRVLRTEARYLIAGRRGQPWARSWIDTQYRPEPSLALWVPDEMYERYEHESRSPVQARARYANHRRFRVETSEEGARLAGEAATP